ncbi:MAG: DUF2059 domain-containing protein [Rhodobacteraceae bacterium]|nr:DUF2059 domain-containing protein [Paracoccaceae bacterium]
MSIRIATPRPFLAAFCAIVLAAFVALPAAAADRGRLAAFLNVTGFDVALESIRLSASAAPTMIGLQSEDFGIAWSGLVADVFDTALMHDMALDILEQTLSDDLLNHGADFYASDLGQRLVAAENAAHMTEDDEAKQRAGEALVADMVARGAPRLELLKRMNAAIDTADVSLRALQEIQVRFLMAASASGLIELQVDIQTLRETLAAREGEMRRAIAASALAGAAQTYASFSDAEMLIYAEALEDPKMDMLYQLMNAVQFEIMANRFEALAGRLAGIGPAQDI